MTGQQVEIFCDFDGTITAGDTIDILLENLADESWRSIEALWEKGQISSRECMSRQVPLIAGGWPAILKVLEGVKVDRSFATFVSWCRRRAIPVHIVSDGLDMVIQHLLKREGIRVDRIWSNHLVQLPEGRLSLQFRSPLPRVVCSSGQCKCQILDQAPSHALKVVIGDGRSDFCWANSADMLFAKDKLLKHCRSRHIPATPYENFVGIRVLLEEMMTAGEPAAAVGHFAEVPLLAQT